MGDPAGVVRAVAVFFAVFIGGRAAWEPRVGDGALVEVRDAGGTVWHRVPRADVGAALRAHGDPAVGQGLSTPLVEGDVVEVHEDVIVVLRGGAQPLLGDAIDVNRAGIEELALIPGIGPSKAQAIVASREEDGPFRVAASLWRVQDLKRRDVERLRPWLPAAGGAGYRVERLGSGEDAP